MVTAYQDLEELLAPSKFHTPRKIHITKPEPKVFFDAEMFRWWFAQGYRYPELRREVEGGLAAGWTLKQWRVWFTANMQTELDLSK